MISIRWIYCTNQWHWCSKTSASNAIALLLFDLCFASQKISQARWESKYLDSCSSYQSSLLNRDRQLQKQSLNLVATNMSRLLNEKISLRDLVIKIDESVLETTYGLIPYLFKKYLRLF